MQEGGEVMAELKLTNNLCKYCNKEIGDGQPLCGRNLENTKSFANNPYYIATKEVLSDIAIKSYYEKETRGGLVNYEKGND